MAKKGLWGGRFKKELDPLLKCFSYSLMIDFELLDAEIKINEAWCKMLGKSKVISQTESTKMLKGIRAVAKQLKSANKETLAAKNEDIHSLIQATLEKEIGPLAKKLHTGRSRNDLVVTSTRIYLRDKGAELEDMISLAQSALVNLATKAGDEIIAGLTHLRMAQPVLMAHHLLAYVEMLEDDKGRLLDSVKRMDSLVLGSAALGGSALPLDQKFLAKELGFSKISTNSLAAVSDRGFVTEFVSALASLWMHLSRLSEDFILWNSEAFHYISLDDAFATGSSLMPQKKNPDVFELLRGRAGVVFGHLNSLLVLQKGLPLAYNRDLQEDKPALFDSIYKTQIALELLAATLNTAKFNRHSMQLSVEEDVLYATDILEYLVRKGTAFAEAHELIGRIVSHAFENETPMREIPLEQWKKFNENFEEDVFGLFEPATSVDAKKTIGSTNPTKVKAEIKRWETYLKK